MRNYPHKIIDSIRDWCGHDEPLDGDEVDEIIEVLRAALNYNQGNLTRTEYEEIVDNLL